MKPTLRRGLTHRFQFEVPQWMVRRVTFAVKAHDGFDCIGEGRHQRFVVLWDKFNARLAEKSRKLRACDARR
jgi:fluoroacetyl-CoA thioesterase